MKACLEKQETVPEETGVIVKNQEVPSEEAIVE
jgi:hypothetical protein